MTSGGGGHYVNYISTFQWLGFSIISLQAVGNISDKMTPLISTPPPPPLLTQLLVGFESGTIVQWDLRVKKADFRIYYDEVSSSSRSQNQILRPASADLMTERRAKKSLYWNSAALGRVGIEWCWGTGLVKISTSSGWSRAALKSRCCNPLPSNTVKRSNWVYYNNFQIRKTEFSPVF